MTITEDIGFNGAFFSGTDHWSTYVHLLKSNPNLEQAVGALSYFVVQARQAGVFVKVEAFETACNAAGLDDLLTRKTLQRYCAIEETINAVEDVYSVEMFDHITRKH